jgi:hypothetical protein
VLKDEQPLSLAPPQKARLRPKVPIRRSEKWARKSRQKTIGPGDQLALTARAVIIGVDGT